MGKETAHRSTFVIAECCSSWRFGPESQHLDNAYRMIVAAKEAGADAAKFQWVSDTHAMSQRRNDYEPKNYEIISYSYEWLEKLKRKCDEVSIEFMCTAFLTKDIPRIAPLVKRFKVASAESSDSAFIHAHDEYKKHIIVSYAFGSFPRFLPDETTSNLICSCSYPTPINQMNLRRLLCKESHHIGEAFPPMFNGLSDHSTSVLTGALAVAAGATVIEKHVRLDATPRDNPDYPHSLQFDDELCFSQDEDGCSTVTKCFRKYVSNIREAELAMGDGKNVMQECERVNEKRRVKA